MDFTFSDDQQAIADLAAQILGDKVTHTVAARARAAARGDGDLFAADAWRALAQADLLGVALPTEVGGGGYGMLGAALVLTEIGRTAAPVPYLASIVTGGHDHRRPRHGRAAGRAAPGRDRRDAGSSPPR